MRRTRAYRRHQRARIKARHLRDYYALVSGTHDLPPPNDVAIRHPLDCGRRCYRCHYEKLWGLPRPREHDWRSYEAAADDRRD